MRKLGVVLLLLIFVGAFAFAEGSSVKVGGEFWATMYAQGANGASGQFPKAELNIDAKVDENIGVSLELDSEGGDWATRNVSLDDFRLNANVFGALGVDLPVSLNWTVGYFDTYFTNWNYVSRSGQEFYYNSTAGGYLWDCGPNANLAQQINVGFKGFTLHYWGDFDFTSMAFALDGGFGDGMFNFLVGFSGEIATFGQGSLWADMGLKLKDLGPLTLYIPAAFAYDLGGATASWSSGVAVDVSVLHVAVGVGGDTATNAFEDINFEVSAAPVAGLDVYAIGNVNLANTVSAFESVDVGASYMFGAMKLQAGYVFALDAANFTSILGDNGSLTGSGLYIGWYAKY